MGLYAYKRTFAILERAFGIEGFLYTISSHHHLGKKSPTIVFAVHMAWADESEKNL